ncbi:MAG TPA: putative baseplate assembly protein [Anaerolineales bacterium]|nr:putative baseplate assembly protein [Anaerolineales bacterium]
MPLADHIPTLDDRTFDDIMTEVRTRISRYTPEWKPVWTDLNDNDPGITLTQVFAWMSEMLLYRMNKVPELNYLKFLQLLGIELNPAGPATAEIAFPVKADYAADTVIVPKGTQVSAQASDGGAPVIFETERTLTAFTAQLASVQVYDSYAYSLATDANTDAAQGFEPFGPLARDDSALLLGFDYAGDFPHLTELNLAFSSVPSESQSAAYQCGFPGTPAFGPAVLVWEYWDGEDWIKLDLLKDETLALTRSGHIYLKTPAKGKMQTDVIGAESAMLYWIRGRVTQSQYENPPQLLAVRTNTVGATQAETLRDEVLGGSDGRRDQVLTLSRTPVLAGSLHLEVDQGDGFVEWTEVEDFFGSSPTDLHYILDRTSGEIRFGDGVNGDIPVANVSNPSANVVAREYRVGGGLRGNVPAGAISNLVTTIDGLDTSGIANLMEAVGGRDEETMDEAKKRAPYTIQSRCRAVTTADFELFASQAANIKRAKALPLYHPDFPTVKVPGVVTVIVVPDSNSDMPTPSEGTLRTVCAYLDQRRLLTTEVYVVKPTYQKVEVTAEVTANDDADVGVVKTAIEDALSTYFHPLKGGEDGLGWPFGGTIYYSRVYQQIFEVDGVQSIQSLTITLDDEDQPAYQDVPLGPVSLLYNDQNDISTNYSFEATNA